MTTSSSDSTSTYFHHIIHINHRMGWNPTRINGDGETSSHATTPIATVPATSIPDISPSSPTHSDTDTTAKHRYSSWLTRLHRFVLRCTQYITRYHLCFMTLILILCGYYFFIPSSSTSHIIPSLPHATPPPSVLSSRHTDHMMDGIDSIHAEQCALRHPMIKGNLSLLTQSLPESGRYYLTLNLYNNVNILPTLSIELLRLITTLTPQRIFLSIYESGSDDATPAWLSLFTTVLRAMNVQHVIVTRGSINRKTQGSHRIRFLSAVRNAAMQPLYEQHQEWQSQQHDNIDDIDDMTRTLLSYGRDRDSTVDADGPTNVLYGQHDTTSYSTTQADTSTTSQKSHTRIPPPRFSPTQSTSPTSFPSHPLLYTHVIFLNDILFCTEDVLRLLIHAHASNLDMVCGLDYDWPQWTDRPGFYDTWVARDRDGSAFEKTYPHVHTSTSRQCMEKGQPFPVFCCWNGLTVLSSSLFYSGLRFRSGSPHKECSASECTHLCEDAWALNHTRIVVDPLVNVAYEKKIYEEIPRFPWFSHGRDHLWTSSDSSHLTHLVDASPLTENWSCCSARPDGVIEGCSEDPVYVATNATEYLAYVMDVD